MSIGNKDQIQINRQFVGKYELEPIVVGDSSFEFVVEILVSMQGEKQFSFKVFRKDYFRLSPSFDSSNESNVGIAADEGVLVEDFSFSASNQVYKSAEDAINAALEDIGLKFQN